MIRLVFIIIIATVVFMALLIGGGVWKLYRERKKLEMDKNTNEESLSNALNNPRTESNNTRRSEATNSTQVTIHVPSNEQNFQPSAPEMDLSHFPPSYEEAMRTKSTNC